MNNLNLYTNVSNTCSQYITKKYSTSFYSAIGLLHKDLHQPIYNIYGFVRLADEIVDTFHQYNAQQLFIDFKTQTNNAIENKISLNPVLHSFQQTVHQFNIDINLVGAFLYSMELDLTKKVYTTNEYEQYIYGSAEVVGLMCLKVFCNDKQNLYNELLPYAKKLGAAFQKVNFLRDIKADNEDLQRMYFPNCNFKKFTTQDKKIIEENIANDFTEALTGIKLLPIKARFGVYVAYKYYYSLFKKIKRYSPNRILENRVSLPNYFKAFIIANASIKYKFNAF